MSIHIVIEVPTNTGDITRYRAALGQLVEVATALRGHVSIERSPSPVVDEPRWPR